MSEEKKQRFIATVYNFKDSDDFERENAHSFLIVLECRDKESLSDGDVALKINLDLGDIQLRYFQADSKESTLTMADYLAIHPNAFEVDGKSKNIIEVYAKGSLVQKVKWENLERENASKFTNIKAKQAQFEEMITVATEMRNKVENYVDKDAAKLRKEVHDRIATLDVPKEFKPEFDQQKSFEDLYSYLCKISDNKEIDANLQRNTKVISPQKMISKARVLYGIVLRPESVIKNESFQAPSKAFAWAPHAEINGIFGYTQDPTEATVTDVMSSNESSDSRKQLSMYQHDFSGKIDGSGAFVNPACLGAFSFAVSANLAKARNKGSESNAAISEVNQSQLKILSRRMQDLKMSLSDIIVKDVELKKLLEAHKKIGGPRTVALQNWLTSNGTHLILRLTFGVARYYEASGHFSGSEGKKMTHNSLLEALQGTLSAAGYGVTMAGMGKVAVAANAGKSNVDTSGDTSHHKKQDRRITVSEKMFSDGLPTGLSASQLDHFVNAGNSCWTVIKRHYGTNELAGIWDILRSQHSQQLKQCCVDVEKLASDLEKIWIHNIMNFSALHIDEKNVEKLISGEDVGTEMRQCLEGKLKELVATREKKEIADAEVLNQANKIHHGDSIYLRIPGGTYVGAPQKSSNYFSNKSYGTARATKAAHFIYKQNGKEGEEIKAGQLVRLVVKNPATANYTSFYRESDDYIYYDLEASVNDEKWWIIDGDVVQNGHVVLKKDGKYLYVYDSWLAAIKKEEGASWVITKG